MMLSEEERKARRREARRRYRAANLERERERDREYKRQLRASNPDYVQRQADAQRKWREANPDKVKENNQKWLEMNRERNRAECARRYRENPDRQLAYNRRWRLQNPELRNCQIAVSNGNRRARLVAVAGLPIPRVTSEAANRRFLLFGNTCCYCGSDGPLHLDHVDPLARGGLHTPGNLAPACQRCNLSKSSKPVEAWYLGQPFFSPERLEALQAHTGRQWSTAEQLTLLSLL